MKRIRHLTLVLASFLALVVATGCTRSLELSYTADTARLANADALARVSLGVARFEDKRPWIDQSDKDSESYVAKQGPWKFGLTWQGKEYVPVKTIVQGLFVAEFGKAGVTAKPIDQVLSKPTRPEFRKAGEAQGADYVLGGEIFVLEFVNEDRGFTITSRRTVTLSVLLVKTGADETLLDTSFSENERKGEGMGILHSTNIDRLMNGVFKKVARQVIEQVAAKLALRPEDVRMRVAHGASAWEISGA